MNELAIALFIGMAIGFASSGISRTLFAFCARKVQTHWFRQTQNAILVPSILNDDKQLTSALTTLMELQVQSNGFQDVIHAVANLRRLFVNVAAAQPGTVPHDTATSAINLTTDICRCLCNYYGLTIHTYPRSAYFTIHTTTSDSLWAPYAHPEMLKQHRQVMSIIYAYTDDIIKLTHKKRCT